MLDRFVKLLTSLRLTVVLLSLGLLLVFVGTLAQVHEGLYEAQTRYFKSWFIWKPTIGQGQWPLLLPGGYLIGTLLLVNLLAAHLKRFQLSWKKFGIHLTHGGLLLLLLGQLSTDMFSTESAIRLAEGETKNYSQDFRANELVLIDTSDPARDRVVSIPESIVTRKGDIRHAALPVTLRVHNYWPNCDVDERPPAAAKPVAADRGDYRNLLLLPLPETSSSGEPARAAALVEVRSETGSLGTFLIPAREPGQVFTHHNHKQTLSLLFAPAMGGNQLIVTDAADTTGDGMIAFPESELVRKTDLHREGLPVTLRVKDFWPNCRLYRPPTRQSLQPAITQGAFRGTMVTPEPLVTDPDTRNLPAAVVEVLTSEGSLGTWLVTSQKEAQQEFSYANKTYELALRFTRYYKPFSVKLLEFTHERYRGTDTPKNFASRIRLQRPDTGEDREVLIYMNNPLRYNGETYYQAGFDPNNDNLASKVTILQVVRNPGWLTPYFACGIVALGLVFQFSIHLVGFAAKRRTA